MFSGAVFRLALPTGGLLVEHYVGISISVLRKTSILVLRTQTLMARDGEPDVDERKFGARSHAAGARRINETRGDGWVEWGKGELNAEAETG